MDIVGKFVYVGVEVVYFEVEFVFGDLGGCDFVGGIVEYENVFIG